MIFWAWQDELLSLARWAFGELCKKNKRFDPRAGFSSPKVGLYLLPDLALSSRLSKERVTAPQMHVTLLSNKLLSNNCQNTCALHTLTLLVHNDQPWAEDTEEAGADEDGQGHQEHEHVDLVGLVQVEVGGDKVALARCVVAGEPWFRRVVATVVAEVPVREVSSQRH